MVHVERTQRRIAALQDDIRTLRAQVVRHRLHGEPSAVLVRAIAVARGELYAARSQLRVSLRMAAI